MLFVFKLLLSVAADVFVAVSGLDTADMNGLSVSFVSRMGFLCLGLVIA